MKKIFLLLFLVVILIPLNTLAVVEKSDKGYVTDAADMLDEEAEEYIVNYSNFLYDAKKIDYYVVTVDNIGVEDINDYTTEVFKEFEINNKGLLIFVSKDERKIRVQAGTELSKRLDSKLITKYINDYFMPYFESGEWQDGIINGYSAFYKYICVQYGINAESMEVVDNIDFLVKYRTVILVALLWLITLLIKAIDTYSKRMKSRKQLRFSEVFAMICLVIANIFAFTFAYILKPVFLVLAIAFEIIILYMIKSDNNNHKKTVVRRRKIVKRRR